MASLTKGARRALRAAGRGGGSSEVSPEPGDWSSYSHGWYRFPALRPPGPSARIVQHVPSQLVSGAGVLAFSHAGASRSPALCHCPFFQQKPVYSGKLTASALSPLSRSDLDNERTGEGGEMRGPSHRMESWEEGT